MGKLSQLTERITTMPKNSGKETGKPTSKLTHMIKTAPSPNPTTGRVLNNAPNPGNAEVPDFVREADGALDMTVARELHFQTKLQDLPLTAEPQIDSCKRVENVAVIMVFYDTLIYLS